MYQLRIECGTDYPDKPPSVWFVTRVNMKSVDSNGRVGTDARTLCVCMSIENERMLKIIIAK